MRIATVTFNPAIDQTITLDRLIPARSIAPVPSGRMRAERASTSPAACRLGRAGQRVRTARAGQCGAVRDAVRAKAIQDRFLRVSGDTRVNMKLVDDADTTDINMSGAAVEGAGRRRRAGGGGLRGRTLIVLSGSLPPGCHPGVYADMIRPCASAAPRVLLDASGPADRRFARPSARDRQAEPARTGAGRALDGLDDVVRCADAAPARVALVVVSMGEDGALFLSDEGAIWRSWRRTGQHGRRGRRHGRGPPPAPRRALGAHIAAVDGLRGRQAGAPATCRRAIVPWRAGHDPPSRQTGRR
jgi:1-phosphofructokinase